MLFVHVCDQRNRVIKSIVSTCPNSLARIKNELNAKTFCNTLYSLGAALTCLLMSRGFQRRTPVSQSVL